MSDSTEQTEDSARKWRGPRVQHVKGVTTNVVVPDLKLLVRTQLAASYFSGRMMTKSEVVDQALRHYESHIAATAHEDSREMSHD